MTTDKNQSELLSIADITKRYRLGRTTIYKLLSLGELTAVKIGSLTRIRHSDISEWLDRQPKFGGGK